MGPWLVATGLLVQTSSLLWIALRGANRYFDRWPENEANELSGVT
jgi:hypothetical protein